MRKWMLSAVVGVVAMGLVLGGVGCSKKIYDTSRNDYGSEAAMRRGVDFLFRMKRAKIFWETDLEATRGGEQVGGQTALALYALQRARRVDNDPRLLPEGPELAGAFNWLRRTQTAQVYPTALKIMALVEAGGEENRAMARGLGQQLVDAMKPGGGYSYKLADGQLAFDMSNSDYGVAGVLVAGQAGLEVPAGYRQTIARFWKGQQNADGGWGYAPPSERPKSEPGLTGGAVASMIALGVPVSDAGVANGLAFLDKNFAAAPNDYYAFFNVGRAAYASGRGTFGGQDWNKMMKYQLLAAQNADGSWYVDQDTFWGHPNATICTAYGVLFLAE